MLATVPSAISTGITGAPVLVEVHVARGLPGFTVVGLPDASCREARDRVRAALLSSGFTWPDQRTTVNLAPSSVRKVGSSLDLAIAMGVLVASGQVPVEVVEGRAFVGELGLDGTLRHVPGMFALADTAGELQLVVPRSSLFEACMVVPAARGASTMTRLVEALQGEAPWESAPDGPVAVAPAVVDDLSEVHGHPLARAALEVAAAGGHHLLMVGPPGAGKTMLARRLPTLLPDLDDTDALEVTRIHSAAGAPLPGGLIRRPPWRAPHHGASAVAMVGGGAARLRPGEISMAHGGVLFLDELGEFAAVVLDSLRQPLEEGVIRIARAETRIEVPARFLLVGAMNPCPCGEGTIPAACRCTERSLERYRRRLSGPLLDRFDLRIDVHRPAAGDLLGGAAGESSATVAARVAGVRARARARGVRTNAELTGSRLESVAPLDPAARRLMEGAVTAGRLSARGMRRVWRVALTVADLAGDDGPLQSVHLTTALQLRTEPGFMATTPAVPR